LLDPAGDRAPLEDAVGQEIPVTIFDSVAPEGMELTSIGNDFCEQVSIASRRLIELLGDECGEVAIMMGVPAAPTLCPPGTDAVPAYVGGGEPFPALQPLGPRWGHRQA
jgi:ABC-type sugar transport system substrate-binding protein